MPRQRKDLGRAATKRIAEMTKAGSSVDTVVKRLRADGVKDASRSTVGRRMSESKRARSPAAKPPKRARSPAAAATVAAPTEPTEPADDDLPLPASPDEIPEDADPAALKKLFAKANLMADAAYRAGNIDGFGKMGRLASAIDAAIQRSTPLKPPDPNENPDMIAAKQRARDMFHNLISRVLP